MCGGVATAFLLGGCHKPQEGHEHEKEEEKAKLVVSRPMRKDTVVSRDFVCQIRSSRNIEIRALERGYLESVAVTEGQTVKQGDPMFKILPLVYQAELRRAEAEAQVAQVEYDNTKRLADTKIVSETELAIAWAGPLSKIQTSAVRSNRNPSLRRGGFCRIATIGSSTDLFPSDQSHVHRVDR